MPEHKKPSDAVRSLHPLEQQNKKIEALERLAVDYIGVQSPEKLAALNEVNYRSTQSLFISTAAELLYKAGFDRPEEIEEEHIQILAEKMNQDIRVDQEILRQIRQRLVQILPQIRRRGPSL